MENKQGFWTVIRNYVSDKTGSIAVLFGIMAPLLIGVAGMSLDYSQAYLVKQRLAQALDAAALAATASGTDQAVIEQKVLDFFAANYPNNKIGVAFTPTVTVVGDEVIVSGTAQYQTLFLRIIGINTIDVEATTTVLREVQGIEVVLVMDNTGSMSTNNNISTLRTAANNFVYIMYGIDVDDGAAASAASLDAMVTRDPQYIKVGLVPYSGSVNVGPYGLGEDKNGDYYGTAFVNNPFNLQYTTNSSSSVSNNNWLGCVEAQPYPADTTDNQGPWDMYRYCRDDNDNANCHGYWYYSNYYPYKGPNYHCPKTPVTPLSSSPSELRTSNDMMTARGYTHGNYGMAWGYRLLSPDFPFEEGVAWTNQYWRKAIVMMTDGVNTIHPYYSAYGRTWDHNLTPSDLNDRFAEVCQSLKDQGAIIYTVTFAGGVSESTKDFYRECATSPDYFFDAPGQQDLIDTFEEISRQLSNLYIVD